MNDKIRILIADTNLCFYDRIKHILGNKGFEILPPVVTGPELLSQIDQRAADIVLMELLLPGIDGVEILEHIRDMEDPPEVFIYSYLSNDSIVDLANRCGVRYFIQKPTELSVIYRRIIGFSSYCQHMSGIDPIQPSVRMTIEEQSRQIITQLLRSLGIPAHMKGYYQLRSAIAYVLSAGDAYNMRVTIDVYPAVAEEFGVNAKRIERNIRNAIEVAWNRGNIVMQHEIFGYTVKDTKGKPTNAEFIAMLADHAGMQMRKLHL